MDLCELIALMLRSRGFDVVAASNGDAALAAILSDGADGLVSDFQMPGLNGLTLSRVLRGLRDYAVLPIVAFTGLGEADPRLIPLRAIPELRILHNDRHWIRGGNGSRTCARCIRDRGCLTELSDPRHSSAAPPHREVIG